MNEVIHQFSELAELSLYASSPTAASARSKAKGAMLNPDLLRCENLNNDNPECNWIQNHYSRQGSCNPQFHLALIEMLET